MSSDGVAQLTSKYHLICRLAVNTVHKMCNRIHSNISFDSLASKSNPWQNANRRLGYLVKDTSKGTSAEGPSCPTWTDLVRCYGSLTALLAKAQRPCICTPPGLTMGRGASICTCQSTDHVILVFKFLGRSRLYLPH